MDTDNQILYLGIIVGWIFTILIISLIGMVAGVNQFILIGMIGVSGGVLFGMFFIVELISFFQNFKIVRRE